GPQMKSPMTIEAQREGVEPAVVNAESPPADGLPTDGGLAHSVRRQRWTGRSIRAFGASGSERTLGEIRRTSDAAGRARPHHVRSRRSRWEETKRRCRTRRDVLGGHVKQITIFARMGIKPENVEKVKALAAEGCKVAADEPGILAYDW